MIDNVVVDDVLREAEEAEEMYGLFNSLHEAFGVMKEEVDELWSEIKNKPSDRDYCKLYKEASHVGAVAIKLMQFIRVMQMSTDVPSYKVPHIIRSYKTVKELGLIQEGDDIRMIRDVVLEYCIQNLLPSVTMDDVKCIILKTEDKG